MNKYPGVRTPPCGWGLSSIYKLSAICKKKHTFLYILSYDSIFLQHNCRSNRVYRVAWTR